jgi:1-phosphatidylinositol-3-phosphate 5-kinase
LTSAAETIDLKTTRLVGGTFVFKGVNSPLQHQALRKALRLCIYVQLSLVLEQHFPADSHAQLKFARPKLNPASPSTPNRHAEIMPPHSAPNPRDGDETKARPRHTLLPSSIFSFFSRKSHVPRSKTINPVVGRGGSLDLTALSSPKERSPRASFDGGLRLRRFSLIGDKRPTRKNSRTKREPDTPFSNALKRLEESKACLSTSPGVSFSPPKVLLDLAQKEGVKPNRRLKGDERASLSTILGWDGKAAQGKGMSGILGFVRQQEISVLFGQHVPPATPPTPWPEAEGSSAFTASSASSNLPTPGFGSCGKPHWVTYKYYSHNPDEDQVLGEAIMDLTAKSLLPCLRQRCPYKRGQHELRLIHGGIRIIVRVDNEVTSPETEDTYIKTWETCAVCSAASEQNTMTDATLYVFLADTYFLNNNN